MLVVADVEELQVGGGVVERIQVRFSDRIHVRSLAILRGKLTDIMRVQFTAGPRHRLVVGLVVGEDGCEGGLELLARVDRHAILGEHAKLVVQCLEIAFHRLRRDRADNLQLAERVGCQGIGRRAIGGNTHQRQWNQGDTQQRQEQLVAKQGSPSPGRGRRLWSVVGGCCVDVICRHAMLPVD